MLKPIYTDSVRKTKLVEALSGMDNMFNLAWQPIRGLLLVIEGLWVRREDKDGDHGTDFGTLFTTRYTV